MPLSGYDDGHDIAPAAYLAVDQINNRTDLLKDYHVKIVRLDGGCDIRSRTALGANELVCSCEPIVGVVGPSCDMSSRIISHITNHRDFSMITINYGGSAESVGNHKFAFGILGTNSMYRKAIDSLIRHNAWSQPSLLFTGDYSDRATALQNLTNLPDSTYEFIFSSSIYDEYYIPLQEVKESFSRIIILLAPPPTVLRVFCLAYHNGMIFPKYQWVVSEQLEQNFHEISFKYDGELYNCSDRQISESLNGSINLFLDAFTPDHVVDTPTDMGTTLEQYRRDYELQAEKYSSEYGVDSTTIPWAIAFYDAVWSLAFALNESLVDFNYSLTEFRPGSRRLAESIRERILNLDIVGVTGRINFDELGYNEENILNIYQFYDHTHNGTVSKTKVGVFEHNRISFDPNVTSKFINGTFKIEHVQFHLMIIISILLFTAVSLLLTISAQLVNIRYRNHKVIKASSPALNHLIFLGCYMIIIGITFHVLDTFTWIDSHLKQWFCNIVPTLLNIGVTLFLGTVCIKTWRLNRLYTNSKKLIRGGIKYINDSFLAGFVTILVTVDLCMCVVWIITDPLIPTTEKILNLQNNEAVILLREECRSHYTVYWLIVLLSPKAVLTLASFLLALSTRFNRREFKTNNVIILTYFLAIIFGLGISMYLVFYFTKVTVTIGVILLSICLNISVCLCLFVLFLPLIRNAIYKCMSFLRNYQ